MGVTQVGSTLPTMSLEELDALRRAINSDLARTEQAKVTGAAANAAMTQRNLLTLKDAVDKLITTSPTLAPGAAQEYMGAMRQFGTEYAPAFRSETARKLLGTKFGAPALKPEDVVKKYFSPGSVTEPTEFLRMAQYDPALLDSMQTGIESLFRREVIEKTGTVDASKAAEFLRKYQDPLRVLSEGGVDIGNVQAVAQQAAQRAAQTQIAAKQVESATQQIAGTEAKLAALAPLEKRLGALQAKIGKEGVAGAAPQTAQEISAIADEVSKRLATQEGFGALAAEGQRLGVKTVEKPSTVKIPLDIKTEIVINILNKLSGGALNKDLSRDIALKVLDNKATAEAIDRALSAKSAEAVRAVGGRAALRFAPAAVNALMSQSPTNNNALAR